MSVPITDLQQLISLLENEGELARITAETNPLQEIAAITDRVCKLPDGGKALLFQYPLSSRFPVATNLFGSLRRVCLALGIENLDRIAERLALILDTIEAAQFDQLDRQIAAVAEFARFAPQRSIRPCKHHITMNRPDLTVFPFLQTWPEDGSAEGFPRYITLPQVFTVDLEGKSRNCGMYRTQIRGAAELAIRWKAGSGAAVHLEKYRQAGKVMPVAIALGGAPSALFSALFPLPGALDEMTFAGFLCEAPLEMAACRTVPLHVPAGAEIVIEGYVNPDETVMEGPFGNHTGEYSAAGPAALIRVTAISHRPDAIVPATVVGPPPMEDCWMAKAWEPVLRAFLRRLVPSVVGISFPLEWVFHQSAVISLETPQAGMVREIAEQLWKLSWFCTARILIFVDADHDVSDYAAVAWRAINSSVFSRDVYYDDVCTRMAIDATGCNGKQYPVTADSGTSEQVGRRWHEFGLEGI